MKSNKSFKCILDAKAVCGLLWTLAWVFESPLIHGLETKRCEGWDQMTDPYQQCDEEGIYLVLQLHVNAQQSVQELSHIHRWLL